MPVSRKLKRLRRILLWEWAWPGGGLPARDGSAAAFSRGSRTAHMVGCEQPRRECGGDPRRASAESPCVVMPRSGDRTGAEGVIDWQKLMTMCGQAVPLGAAWVCRAGRRIVGGRRGGTLASGRGMRLYTGPGVRQVLWLVGDGSGRCRRAP